jgi:outer membrane protein assembly factor BamB
MRVEPDPPGDPEVAVSSISSAQPLRLWPGVAIVVLQLLTFYVPSSFAAAGSPAILFAVMGSLIVGTLLLWLWWLLFSRARWSDRLGGLALMIGAHAVTLAFVHPSAKIVAVVPGVPWLCAAFVASLFAGRRWVTVAAVLIASLGWTLVRTDGVTGSLGNEYAWRWSATAEDRFMASEASAAPPVPVTETAPEGSAWPGFRGARRDGVVPGVTIDSDWATEPPRQLWRRPVGPGWSSFALAANRLCTQEQRDEDEVVVCYDAASGEPVWLYAYPARFWEAMGGLGPRATPTFHDGRLFTLGATGLLNCLDAATGQPVWTRDLAEDADAPLPTWGFSSSPLVVDDLVLVHAPGAADGRGLVAYDIRSGEPRWRGQAPGGSYSSPQLATVDGVRQVVMITNQGLYGVRTESGELLWQHDWPVEAGGDRVVQPAIVDGGTAILIGTSFGLGTRKVVVARDGVGGWTTREAWTSRGLKPYYNDLVVHRGTAYGYDGNILAAIDVATGERRWKGGRYGNGQLLLLAEQELLLVVSERGELVLVRATPERFEEVARVPAIEGKTWNHPIVAEGVVYLRNAEEAAAFQLPGFVAVYSANSSI